MEIHIHFDGYAPAKPPQVSEGIASTEPAETDQEKEYRLMAKYADREQTLTEEEHDFLKRRGCVRY